MTRSCQAITRLDLGERRARQQYRHEKQTALIEPWHKLAAHALGQSRPGIPAPGLERADHRPGQAEGEHERHHEQRGRTGQHGAPMRQRPVQRRVVNRQQPFHQPVVLLAAERAAHPERAEHGHQGDRQQGRADHGEGLGEGQGMEQLAFLADQREHRHERQDDDQHGEENRPADLLRRLQRGLPDFRGRQPPVAQLGLPPLAVPNDVFRHDNPRIHQHSDGDGDAAQGHDVRRDPELLHQDERNQDRSRQRDRDDQDAAEVPEENDVRQRDQDDFLGQRPLQRRNGSLDQRAAVVKRPDAHARRAGWKRSGRF